MLIYQNSKKEEYTRRSKSTLRLPLERVIRQLRKTLKQGLPKAIFKRDNFIGTKCGTLSKHLIQTLCKFEATIYILLINSGLCKYQMLSPELLHHLSFVLLLLSPDVFQIFLAANPGAPEIQNCNCF